MVKFSCGSWWTWYNITSRQVLHTFFRSHFTTPKFPQLRTYKGRISQKWMNFERLLLLMLSPKGEGHTLGSCWFLLWNLTTSEVLSPLCVLAFPYCSWSSTSTSQQNTVPGCLLYLPPLSWQSDGICPRSQIWELEKGRVNGNRCSIIHMAKMYPEVSHACLPLNIYIK